MDLEKRLAYTYCIIIRAALEKYPEVLVTCRKLAKELTIYEQNLGKLTGLSAEKFWTWDKTGTTGYGVHVYLDLYKCIDF